MTNVIIHLISRALIVSALCVAVFPQAAPPASARPAEALYLKLRSVGLDKSRVYKVRDGAIDRASIHLSLDDGTIAFTEDAGGHISGAFFTGEGEILLVPQNVVERASLASFTGAAILEEHFSVAYLRFNDDVYNQLKPSFRPADDPAAFAAEWNATAQNLAEEDALRLLISFGCDPSPPAEGAFAAADDRFLHAFLQGDRLGTFDVRYDSALTEQISAGQHKTVAGLNYYDVWTSFSVLGTPSNTARTIAAANQPALPDFDVTRFKIRSRITPPTTLDSTAVLTITPRRNGKKVLLFELSRLLQVKNIEIDGHPVESIHNPAIEGSQLARRGNDLLAVFLPSPLQAGHTLVLTVAYSGTVLSEAGSGLLYVGEHGTWYPSVGFVMSTFDLEFQYPAEWTLVATGRRVETNSAGGEQTSRWISERPVPVAGFNLGKYSKTVTRAGDVSVETFATSTMEDSFARTADKVPAPDLFGERHHSAVPLTPQPVLPSPSRNAQMVGSTAARAVEFYQQHFGAFPYSQLSLTQFPGLTSQGWPGLVFLSSYAFLSPSQHEQVQNDPRIRLMMEQVIAHETAHQWWGDLVTWSGYRDQWIMEALANYSSLMLLESQNSAQFHTIMRKYRDDLLAKNQRGNPLLDSGPVTLGVRLSSSQFPNAYEAVSYGRGTWLLHMLRTMLRDSGGNSPAQDKNRGEEPFLRALHKLRTQYEGKTLTTSQLIAAFESELPRPLWYEGHKSLEWFFEGWVNGNAVPLLELRDVKFAEKSGASIVSGTIIQEHAPDALVTAVPLYASQSGGNRFLGRVFAEGHETHFQMSVPAGTRKIVADPEQTLLTRAK